MDTTPVLQGEGIAGATVAGIVLTFLVPFGVSLYSPTMADRARR